MFQPTTKQIIHALESMMLFSRLSLGNRRISPELEVEMRDRFLVMIEELESESLNPNEAVMEMNQWVERLNGTVSQEPAHPPYPELATSSEAFYISNSVVAFEEYLQQELLAAHIPFNVEKGLFDDAIILWREVSNRNVDAKQGKTRFNALVEKMNTHLPAEERYPRL